MLTAPMRLRTFACPVLAALTACFAPPGNTDGGNDGGNLQPPELTSVSPTRGPKSGGTTVTVNGANFEDGIRVWFGATEATEVSLSTRRRLTARTPASASLGVVDVKVVNPDGQSATLNGAFTYEADVVRAIEEAAILNELDARDFSGAASVNVSVLAEVFVPGLTQGQGQGQGIKAQVGYATSLSTPPAQSDFTFIDATYLGDADGPQLGDLSRDRYTGQVTLGGATGAEEKRYHLAARFSIDDGQSWVLADRDGSANGIAADRIPKVTLSRPTVDWCKLGGEIVEAPPDVRLKVGQPGVTIYSQVYKQNVTNQSGRGAGISGQIGYGAPNTDPAAWTWVDADYHKDTGGTANDEYRATLPNPGEGTYAFAFRYSFQGGPYRYCDADGSQDQGYTHDQAGRLTVTQLDVDRCVLQFPSTLELRTGVTSGTVYGRVWSQTVTDQTGQGAGITAELGYGPQNVPPTDPAWQWTNATFNVDVDNGAGDEYQATFTGPAAGSYHYAYRFRYGARPWVYCDLDGSQNGWQSAQAGQMTSRPIDVDACRLQGPASAVGYLGQPSPRFFGRVLALGVTDQNGRGQGITAEIGFGPAGSTPPSGWTFVAATYGSDQDNGLTDEYAQALSNVNAGTYDVAYRFRYQTNAFVYCDLDGSGNGYSPQQAAKLTIEPPCRLESVNASGGQVNSGAPVQARARIKVPGLTELAGAPFGVRAQVGVGTQGDNASQSPSWGWMEASWAADDSATGEDEFQATFHPAYTGTRAVSFRFSLDNGQIWAYCDMNGNAISGYEVSQQYNLMVRPHADLDWCNLQFPPTLTQSTDGGAVVYGRVYEGGLTPDRGAPIFAELGFGKKIEDPGLAWTWVPASFNVVHNNDNEYQASLPAMDAGTYHYAFRFTRTSGPSYCYADLDGHGANSIGQTWEGFQGEAGTAENLGVATVTP